MSPEAVFTEFVAMALAACGIGAVNVWQMVRRGAHDYARWVLVALLLVGSAAFLFEIPAVYQDVDQSLGVANVSILLSYGAWLLCSGLGLLWIGTWPGVAPDAARSILLLWLLQAVALASLFFTGTHPVESPGTFDARYAHDPSTAGFLSCYLFSYSLSWSVAVWKVHEAKKLARGAARADSRKRWLARSLAWVEFGTSITLIYALCLAQEPASAVLGVAGSSRIPVTAAKLQAVSATISLIGLSFRFWGPAWDRFLGARAPGHEDRVAYRRLGRLYRLVIKCVPRDLRSPRGLGLEWRDCRNALTYQVTQIDEALIYVASYVDARVVREAREQARAYQARIVIRAAVRAQRRAIVPAEVAPLPIEASGDERTDVFVMISDGLPLLGLREMLGRFRSSARVRDSASRRAPRLPEPSAAGSAQRIPSPPGAGAGGARRSS